MSEKTILVSGAFNPLHFGHLLLFREASKYGKVVVALNSDEWVKKNKGYLLYDFEARKSLLEECKYVSKVVSFDDSDGDAVYALFEINQHILETVVLRLAYLYPRKNCRCVNILASSLFLIWEIL